MNTSFVGLGNAAASNIKDILLQAWLPRRSTSSQKAIAVLIAANIPPYLLWSYHNSTCPDCRDSRGTYTCTFGWLLQGVTVFDWDKYPLNTIWTTWTSCITHRESEHFWVTMGEYVFYLYMAPYVPLLSAWDVGILAATCPPLCNLATYLRGTWLQRDIEGNGGSSITCAFLSAFSLLFELPQWWYCPIKCFVQYVLAARIWNKINHELIKSLYDESGGSACHALVLAWGVIYGLGKRALAWYWGWK